MELNYFEDLEIERDNLDKHFIEQPILFMRYAEELANAEEARDKAKRELEVARAEADGAIREAAAASGEKLTEAKVATQVSLYSTVSEAERSLISATKNAKLLISAVRAFEQKKKSLEKLAELYIAGYWSGPSDTTVKKIEKRLQEKIGE